MEWAEMGAVGRGDAGMGRRGDGERQTHYWIPVILLLETCYQSWASRLPVPASPRPRVSPSPVLATGLVWLATKVVYAELNSYNGFRQKKRGHAPS